jgi:hypothetical protein
MSLDNMAKTTAVAMERMELYCIAHPGSPSAVRRPRLRARGEIWIALLGPSVQNGIVGFGKSVESALRAFDAQYLKALRPQRAVVKDEIALSCMDREMATHSYRGKDDGR